MSNLIKSITEPWNEFPKHFKILMGASFIDGLGGALLFPFFGLYVTSKFGVGMIEVGAMFAVWAVTSQIGNVIGGALADKLGRKTMVIFGLVASATSSIALGLVSDITFFYFAAAFAGLFGDMGRPAQQAMVADLLPKEQQAQGYGIWRVIANLTVMIGPILGGWMAGVSYLLLFITDAISSIITAFVVYKALPETKPETIEEKESKGLLFTFSGYLKVFKDNIFVKFLIAFVLMNIVYVQMNTTLPVFLRDIHQTPPSLYGILLSTNAAIVVLLQFWVTRKMSKVPPMLAMALGAVFYMVGFGMYGFVSGFFMFLVAMILLTIGEMVALPVSQAMVAQFAPEDMRGRYMAVFGLGWSVPFAVGPFIAGLVIEKIDPNWVWYGSMIVCAFALLGFLRLQITAGKDLGNPMVETEKST